MEDLTESIDLYLSDKLSKEERLTFEEQMSKDEALAKEVELQRKISELLEAEAWLQTKEKVAALNTTKSGMAYPLLKVAAVFFGLLVGSYFLISSQYTNEALYADYASPYPDRITSMGEVEEEIATAMRRYNDEEYKVAADLFEQLRKKGRVREELLLYESIALTESDQAEKAAELLESYGETIENSGNLKEAFAWQKILIQLANNNSEDAYLFLEKYLAADYSYQQQKAKQLKEDLESFWR